MPPLRLLDVRSGQSRDVPVVPGTDAYTTTTDLDHTAPGAGALLVGVDVADVTTGLAPRLAVVDVASATARAVFLGDVGDPVAVDPTVQWVFASGRTGLQGGRLGDPLRPLPIDVELGSRPGVLVAVRRG